MIFAAVMFAIAAALFAVAAWLAYPSGGPGLWMDVVAAAGFGAAAAYAYRNWARKRSGAA